jgi:Nucleotidyltransferase domain
MTLPAPVSDLVSLYLQRIDEAAPGLVTGLHVVGSTALGAWQPGRSDIDTVILTSRSFTPDDLAAVEAVHGTFSGSLYFDGVYLDPATFAAQPMDRSVVPFVVMGALRTDRPCGELNPVVWLILSRYGIAVRGPRLSDLTVSSAALEAYNRTNLHEYWAPLAEEIRSSSVDAPDDQPVEASWVDWAILGPARLHYTLATGDVIAKPDVAAYIAREFPAWGPLAARAAAYRSGAAEAFTMADLRACADHIDAVVTSV